MKRKIPECEECGRIVFRRVKCSSCNKMLCPYCFHHSFHTKVKRTYTTKSDMK